MRKHICFEAIDCKKLSYTPASKSWVCLRSFTDLKCVDSCMSCKLLSLYEKENEIRREKERGIIL